MTGPRFRCGRTKESVQDLGCASNPELARRLRQGSIGLEGLGYPLKFHNLQIEELPSTDRWTVLWQPAEDIAKHWMITDNSERAPVRFVGYGPVLWCDGSGNLGTKQMFDDFELQLYIRGPQHHNSGVDFPLDGETTAIAGKYEVQVHNVPEAHYPTGWLYHYKRAPVPAD
ncbi:MAG: family 16 glycoside hydrolase [Bryobacterales bacterium]|nr:family 16 glycoside hydrolase [Bryobacterales bacterium]